MNQYFSHTENLKYIEISFKSNYNINKIKKLIEEIEIDEDENEEEKLYTAISFSPEK